MLCEILARYGHRLRRHAAQHALKRDERLALWLLGLGLSYAEVCELTGWTYTKLNRCATRGRARLRERGSG